MGGANQRDTGQAAVMAAAADPALSHADPGFSRDFTRQITPTLTTTWNYGASRGLNLIPGFNSEVDVYYAPYLQHNTPKVKMDSGMWGFSTSTVFSPAMKRRETIC